MASYDKEYRDTLNRMDAKTLAGYMSTYIKHVEEKVKALTGLVDEITLMHKLLLKKLEKK